MQATPIEKLPQGTTVPRAGQPWPGIEGAIYAGLIPGFLDEPDYHLVLLAEKPERDLPWQAAMDWARGFGADLPNRNESAFLYAFHRERFTTDWYYWTSTQYSGFSAWDQLFSYGGQGTSDTKAELRARAVRRFNASILQSLEGEAQTAEAA